MKKLLLILLCLPLIGFGQCDAPTGLNTVLFDSTSVQIQWDTQPTADYFRLKYRQIGSNSWMYPPGMTNIPSTDSMINLNNLTTNTLYEYKMRTYCTSGNSSWSSVYEFTTSTIYGCTDFVYPNFNPLANIDDSSCFEICSKFRKSVVLFDGYTNGTNYPYFNAPFNSQWDDGDVGIKMDQNGDIFICAGFYDDYTGNTSITIDGVDYNLNWGYNDGLGSGSHGFFKFNKNGDLLDEVILEWNHASPWSDYVELFEPTNDGGFIMALEIDDDGVGMYPLILDYNNTLYNYSNPQSSIIVKYDEFFDVDWMIDLGSHLLQYQNDIFQSMDIIDNQLLFSIIFDSYNDPYTISGCCSGTPSCPLPPLSINLLDTTLELNYGSFDTLCDWSTFSLSDNLGFLASIDILNASTNFAIPFDSTIFNENNPPLGSFKKDNFFYFYTNDSISKFDVNGNEIAILQGFSFNPEEIIAFNNNLYVINDSSLLVLDDNLQIVSSTSLSDTTYNMYLDNASNSLFIYDTEWYYQLNDSLQIIDSFPDFDFYYENQYYILNQSIDPSIQDYLRLVSFGPSELDALSAPVTCTDWMDGSVSVNPNLGIPPYTYQWSTGDNTAQVDQLGMGTYSVTVTDSIGCVITDSVSVELDVAPSDSMLPEICYVTVDVNTGYNKIVLKPLASSLTAQYVIFKETSATVFSPLDTIDANTLVYVDYASNPTVQANRYKVSAIDVCGNPSDTSSFHKTLHLTMNTGTNGEVNLIWNLYEGYLVPNYLIYRGSSGSNMNMIATIQGNLTSFTDQFPPSGNLEYQIRAIGQVCNVIPNAMIIPDTLESNIITHSIQANINIATVTQDPSCPTCSDGYIIVSAYGGIAPYTYVWTNGLTGNFLGNLSSGTYTVFVFDNAGNQASESVTLGASGPVLGCTDMAATNYDPSATIDDGSCTYSTACTEPSPTGLNVTDVVHNRVTINWDDMNDANCTVDQYRIKYREVGTSSWNQKNMGTPLGSCTWACNKTDKLILGLSAGTTYEYQMRAWYCGGGNSAWTALYNFTTLDTCPNIGNLTVTTPTTTKATFTWDDSNGPYSFVRLKSRVDTIANPVGTDWFNIGGAGVVYPTFTKDKNNLTPGESYRAQARTWCNPSGGPYKSDTWTSLVTWTQPTSVRIEGGESITHLDVYPNPSRDIFNITFTSEQIQNLRVRVLNVIGEELISDELQQFVGEYTKQIDLTNNAKGIYFLEIETNQGVINKKLILQ